jgi:phage I-like protein
MDLFHLSASLALPDSSGELPTRIVYLPEGTHHVQGSVNGKPAARTITVGAHHLAPLQEALAARLTKNVRPHGGFDHKEGKASFIPKAFHYEAGRGVVLEVEWTKSGKEAIEGKDYSYFSPSFMASKKDGAPIGLPMHGEIGSLVNEPAFESIERIAASRINELNQSNMELHEEIKAACVSLNLITEAQLAKTEEVAGKVADLIKANLESSTKTAVDTAVAEATKDAPEKSALETEVAALKEENTKLSEALSAKRAAEADSAIAEAVTAGRIPAQDEDTKAFWKDAILKDDSGKAKAQLAKLPGAEALKAGRKIDITKGGEEGPTGLARVTAAFKASN